MTWIKFALWMSGIYLMYYGLLILWDYLRNGRPPAREDSFELSFDEHIEPVKAIPENPSQVYDSCVLSSGGVSLKQLFSLAREEAIEFTRPVSF